MTRLVPRMQRYRNNLTALSQLYNVRYIKKPRPWLALLETD